MFTPQWRPLAHEAGLASYSLRGGLASLRKANYAEPEAYYGGFFQYTIGLERVMKLALVIDHVCEHGNFPSNQQYARRYGHKLTDLLVGVTDVRTRLDPSARVWELPDVDVTDTAIACLSDFASGARYYNVDVLTGAVMTKDPVDRWFSEVGVLLLSKRKRPLRDVEWAREIDLLMGQSTDIRFESENGTIIRTFAEAAAANVESEFVAKEGTLLCAQIARHAISILIARGYQVPRSIMIPNFVEFFYLFLNKDAYLKRQKSFSN